MKKLILLFAYSITFFFFPQLSIQAQNEVMYPEKVITATYFDVTPPLRDMELIQPGIRKRAWKDNVIKNKTDFMEEFKNPQPMDGDDPLLQDKDGTKSYRGIGKNFDGVNNLSGVAPPDTDGDVGPNHYFQMVNLAFAIYDKNGTKLYGPADNSTLWNGFVGSWTGTNDGDPIILYDEMADRWMASQFAINTTDGTQWELVAISQTPDPTGAWYRYAFQFTYMPDYPKFGVWSDGYYLSVNQFQKSGSTYTWKGAGACVLNRAKMLAGNATAEMVFFNLGTAYGSLLPADFDGTALPPTGTPNYFTSVSSSVLQIWALHADWTNTSNSTITKLPDVPVASYNTSISVTQPGTTQILDNLADRLMYRLQYRNFGSYQAMVTNHTVNAGSSRAGVRWYELRKTGTNWTLYQQGTYAPADGNHRWMASVAMNSQGDIGLGYSVSGSSTYPSIRYTGRNNGDPLGTMTMAETTIFAGTKSQTGVSRWGDYSSMSVDPSNDLDFWFTTEYSNSGWAWRTRIASFNITPAGPSLQYLSNTISDPQGNNNGKIDAGETANISVIIQNNGSTNLTSITGTLSESDPYFSVNTTQAQSFGNIAVQATGSAVYSVTASSSTPVGHNVTLTLNLLTGTGLTFTGNFSVIVGQPGVVIIDLDPNASSGPVMKTSMTTLGVAADYVTTIPANLNDYQAAFVCLGIYSSNHVLTSTEGQTLANFLTAGKKLYMEGGDTWAYDAATAVHTMFKISGVSDGSGDMATVQGQTGTLTAGISFTYSGENSWMDRIGAISPAYVIFKNSSPVYNCGVAYNPGTYKTIGVSYEFGGAGTTTIKNTLMQKYLEFFGMINQPAPDITISPATLNETLKVGQTSQKTLSINNIGTANLTYSLQISYSNGAGWLSVSPNSGTVIPGASASVTVGFNAGALVTGTYAAKIVITSNDPGSPTIEIPVNLVVWNLIADFSANLTTIYAGGFVDFTDLSTNNPTSWSWTFEGAQTTTSALQNPSNIVYPTPGVYDVSLTVSNAFGSDVEIKTNYISVEVLPLPVADFSASLTTIYAGGFVDFTDLSTNNPTSWSWTFEGAQTATSALQNPSNIVYPTPGVYDVSLTVSNAFGSDTESKTNYITVEVLPLPVADFSANLTTIYAGGSVNFTDLSTNNPTSWSWTFEGAQTATSALQNPSNIVYPTPRIYDVSLTVSNAFGSDTKTKLNFITVEVLPLPVADFSANLTTIYAGGSVNFTDLSTNNPTSWSWTFEGALTATSALQNPSNIVYDTPGVYDVSLTVSNAFGSDTETKTNFITVDVLPLPVADYSTSLTTIYAGGSVDFTDLSTNNPTSWSWTFEGAQTATSALQNPSNIVYATPGVYDVSLTVSNAFGSDTKTKLNFITVEVLPLPVADFSANLTTIYAGGSVNFTDLSTNNPTSWSWTFEGAQTATSVLQNPSSIVYPTPGVYDVSLTISNAFGSDTETKLNYITVEVLPLPVADFSANLTTIYAGGSVDFTDLSTNNPTSWSWTFEGAQTATSALQNPLNIVYPTPGIYDVSLTVSNAFGSDTETKTNFITVEILPLPVADFSANLTTIYAGGSVDFTDISTNNPTSWSWAFEGAQTATSALQNPSNIVYPTPGIYDVSLTVSNAFGSDTESKTNYITVEVLPLPVADFSANLTTIYAGGSVNFTDLSTNNPTSWSWTFEGAQTATSVLQNPSNIVYPTPGVYDVSLTISNAFGSDTETKLNYITVEVLPLPVADFSASLTTIYAGGSVDFTDISANNPTSWSWTFEGAQTATSALQNPSNIVYPTPGIYDVSLTVSNAFGSDAEIKANYITVNVVDTLIADFTADKIVIERGEVVHFTDISSGNPVFWSWEIEGGDPTLVHLQNPAVVFDFAGSYDVKLTVYRAGGSDVEIKYDYIQVNEIESDLPPGWDFVATSRSHIIAVPLEANPRIHLTPLQPGDFIGVFYNGPGGVPICGGNAVWDGVSNIPVIAFGDESSTIFKDGFSVNEAFQWKIYSVSMQREFDATVIYDPAMATTGNFYPYGLSALTDIYSGDVFNVMIPAGWSGISSPVDPWEKNLETLFSPLDGNLAMFYNFNGMYLPGLNINTLVNWNNHTAYNIKLEYPAELEFLGYPEKSRTVAIPQGWSYLPVPVACDVDVLPLFLSNLSKLVIVREISGFNMYWPQYNIRTLTTLQPGKAYMINASAAFNLQFPVCTSTFKNSGSILANSIHLNPAWNALPAGAVVHTFAVTGQALSQLKTGDVLGAFTSGGFCAGMARFEGNEFAVSVFGDDITTPAKDGFEVSEPAIFKLFRPSDGTEIFLDVSFDPSLPQDGRFAGNGLSAISAFKASTEVGGIYKPINPAIHPNPSQGKFMISGILEVSKITVMSMELQKIIEIKVDGVSTQLIDLSQQPKGIYLISFETPNGPLLKKIVID